MKRVSVRLKWKGWRSRGGEAPNCVPGSAKSGGARARGAVGGGLLKPLDVLSALCSLVLSSNAYPDKRLRVAICNILLQRVQARVTLDKHTQAALNQRLFPITPQGTPNDEAEGA